jgi:hypothetical protein
MQTNLIIELCGMFRSMQCLKDCCPVLFIITDESSIVTDWLGNIEPTWTVIELPWSRLACVTSVSPTWQFTAGLSSSVLCSGSVVIGSDSTSSGTSSAFLFVIGLCLSSEWDDWLAVSAASCWLSVSSNLVRPVSKPSFEWLSSAEKKYYPYLHVQYKYISWQYL